MTIELASDEVKKTNFSRILFVNRFFGEASRRLAIKLYQLSHIKVESEYNLGCHRHVFYEIILPYRGKYKCILNGAELTLRTGMALLIQPGDWHEDFYLPDSELLFIQFYATDMFDCPWNDGFIRPSQHPEQRIINIAEDVTLNELIDLILRHERDAAGHLVALGKLCEAALWELTVKIPVESLCPEFRDILKHNEFVRQCEEYFHRHTFRKLDMKDLCQSLGMCRRAVEKKFMEAFNDSPLNAFTKFKIKIAIDLLVAGKSIKEVSEQLGFSDQFYFSTVFKRVTGYPPSRQLHD